ncbi:MAG: molybdopterin molybdotransferase MoeA [Microbacterium gubbeenense]|uniref:molybdopterin molybdotransferase MoeA n=1 Tax=Microbacterium gubbeenense TaxID=159896 RepID=UPI003F9BC205
MSALVPIGEHRERILAAVSRLGSEELPVTGAEGRTLVADALSLLDIPAFDNSAMDGFAVRFDDVKAGGATLRVVADVPAGSADDPRLAAGDAARIMTGAPVPTDADAIVPFEDTAGGLADSLGSIRVTRAPRARGAHIRRRAEDLAAGDIALPAGRPLGPLQISSLIASGVTSVGVARRPRVAVVSTGAELTAPGVVPGAGEIPDSNSTLLERLCAQAGAEVVVRAHVGDDPAELLERLEHTAADVVITSGGVSAGAYEPVKLALDKRIRFDRVAMQPGKPQAFGVLEDGALFFGLPGNPVSVAVSFEMFVRPALLALQGRAQIDRPRGRFPATEGWRTPVGRTQVIPVAWDGAGVRPATAGGSGSHLAGGLGLADAYAIVDAETAFVAPGDVVDVMLFA